MTRPRIPYADSAQKLIDHMKPGIGYLRDDIAEAVGMERAKVGDLLTWMKGKGFISKAPFRGHTCHWQIAEKEPEVEPDMTLSIATPPVHIRLDGTLTGYDAEFRTRAELAMMGRGR